jgi:Mg2+ and Co2+ transporter CorA
MASNHNEEQMDNSIRSEIEDVADEVLDLAERLVSVGEKLNRLNSTLAGQESIQEPRLRSPTK